ncbi:hypothetical protein GCM10010106_51050 [Thermopolyspora flexuosa]|nr:hypothetical protein GCM10010106_51050 [Thermopolyspora flexuosa]
MIQFDCVKCVDNLLIYISWGWCMDGCDGLHSDNVGGNNLGLGNVKILVLGGAFKFGARNSCISPVHYLGRNHGFCGEVGFDWGWCNIGLVGIAIC